MIPQMDLEKSLTAPFQQFGKVEQPLERRFYIKRVDLYQQQKLFTCLWNTGRAFEKTQKDKEYQSDKRDMKRKDKIKILIYINSYFFRH